MTALELELSVVEQHLGAVREGELTIRENVGGVVVVLLVLDVAVHLFEAAAARMLVDGKDFSSASSKS